MERIGVLGGSFNPPHRSHIQVALSVVRYFSKVLVVPCGDRPDKQGLVPGPHRLAMTQLAFRGLSSQVEISTSHAGDIEIQNGAMIPTYYLLQRIRERNPQSEVWLIVGTDLLPTLPQWNEGQRLIEENLFFVIPRTGYQVPEEYKGRRNFEKIADDYQETGISSTEVRASLASNSDAAARELPPAVLDYIRTHHLYGSSNTLRTYFRKRGFGLGFESESFSGRLRSRLWLLGLGSGGGLEDFGVRLSLFIGFVSVDSCLAVTGAFASLPLSVSSFPAVLFNSTGW